MQLRPPNIIGFKEAIAAESHITISTAVGALHLDHTKVLRILIQIGTYLNNTLDGSCCLVTLTVIKQFARGFEASCFPEHYHNNNIEFI